MNDGGIFGSAWFEEREPNARAASVSRWAQCCDLQEITTCSSNAKGKQTRRRQRGQRGSQLDYVFTKRYQCAEAPQTKFVQNHWNDFDHAQIIVNIQATDPVQRHSDPFDKKAWQVSMRDVDQGWPKSRAFTRAPARAERKARGLPWCATINRSCRCSQCRPNRFAADSATSMRCGS